MVLIADSGSTKTDWRLIKDNGDILSFETVGFNPYFVDSAHVLIELANSRLTEIKDEVTQVYFYGAGCSSQDNCRIISKPLSTVFPNAEIKIEHDMLAAVRATCGNNRGMVAILGTGSNSCLYDGEEIIDNVAGLGYLLGDYGAGSDIGKAFIKAYLGKELPTAIAKDFDEKYNLDTTDILSAVYKQDFPNRFLAGFNPFVYENIGNGFIREITKNRIKLFFEKNMCKYTNYKNETLFLVGSVAYVYQDIIKEIALEYQIKVGDIIKQPIDHLVNYHNTTI